MWSQEGEDVLLRRIFENKDKGFYVDIGAHHPKRFSNTYFFYRRGWHGINIDPMPDSMNLFKKLRPRDINLEIGIAKESGALDYYIFNEPALNGFSKDLSYLRNDDINNSYFIKDILKVPVKPLAEVLDHYATNQKIDFMTVDVEGLDLEVLQSNNWDKYRPQFVLAEILDSSLDHLAEDPLVRFMVDNGYSIYAKLFHTTFFKRIS